MIGFIFSIIVLYLLNKIFKNPYRVFLKLFKIFKPKKSINKKPVQKKVVEEKIIKPPKPVKEKKYVYKDIGLGRFKLSKLNLTQMIKDRFIYPSDMLLPEEKYRKSFICGVENFILWKFPHASEYEVSKRVGELVENNLEYWLKESKSYVKT